MRFEQLHVMIELHLFISNVHILNLFWRLREENNEL